MPQSGYYLVKISEEVRNTLLQGLDERIMTLDQIEDEDDDKTDAQRAAVDDARRALGIEGTFILKENN